MWTAIEETKEIYSAWRESEAYAVPMTDAGEKLANQRWYGFQKGWLKAKEYYEQSQVSMGNP